MGRTSPSAQHPEPRIPAAKSGCQGDNPQKVLALGENEIFNGVRWSPDGERLAYIRVHTRDQYQKSIETCDLKGASRTVVVPDSDLWLRDLCWLPDGRIVYSRQESPLSNDDNLWQIGINGQTGTPSGKPKRITQSAGAGVGWLSASADGKRLEFQMAMFQIQVYLGELTPGGSRMNPPRRLTNDEAFDVPTAWTPDSKGCFVSVRPQRDMGYLQAGNQPGHSRACRHRVAKRRQSAYSADGAWILYPEIPKTAVGSSTPIRLMRIPAGGGVPQLVMETKGFPDVGCARAPASLCWIIEVNQDEKQLTVTRIRPRERQRRGKNLRLSQPPDRLIEDLRKKLKFHAVDPHLVQKTESELPDSTKVLWPAPSGYR